MKFIRPIEYQDVYPGHCCNNIDKEITILLETLCRSKTVEYCIHLNLYISDLIHPLNSLLEQKKLLEMFFDKWRLEKIIKAAPNNSTFFHRTQLLELIKSGILYCPDCDCHKSPVKNMKSKEKFIKAALIATELVDKRSGSLEYFRDGTDEEKRKRLLKSMRILTTSGHKIIYPERAFGRGISLFFEFLPKEFPKFDMEFLNETGISLQDYYTCLFIVFIHYYDIPNTSNSYLRHYIHLDYLQDQLPRLAITFNRYLQLESHTLTSLFEYWATTKYIVQNSYKPIREKPILRFDIKTAIVIDPVFHIEKAMVGPLFLLSKSLEKKKINLQGHFGDAFEKYTQQILLKMYLGKNQQLINVDDLKIAGDQICDAMLLEGESLFIFEIKAVWLRDEATVSPDCSDFIEELRKKFGKKDNAAYQLARAVNNLINGKWKNKKLNFQNIKRIYPTLIVYDQMLDAPGFSWFFSSEFRKVVDYEVMYKSSKTLMQKSG